MKKETTVVEEEAQKKAIPKEQESLIDTSKMSKGKQQALEVTEEARYNARLRESFVGQLFFGKMDWDAVYPFPSQSKTDHEAGAPFLKNLKHILDKHVDADAIDREGEIPEAVLEKLAMIGAFGIKIPKNYGGQGLSQINYTRAAMILGAECGNLTALLSAHQSIGVPQPLLVFGTEEQKKKYLPRFSRGEISAFALTENEVGSDPSKMKTRAEPTEDGEHFIINGEKLWCTNGVKATVIVVMAQTPPKMIKGRERKQITAFVVDMDTPGVEVAHRCRFMGLKALYNGVIKFNNVKVPRENIIAGEGKGLKVALTTLNTGRITLPAACVGLSKECLRITQKWTTERSQWGAQIGKHAAIAEKVARMAAQTFAMESTVLLTSALVDGKKADIRLEAAMSKMWGTEMAWKITDETLQIRGGRGYETADSLRDRGEEPVPIERFLRDCRINLIFEGSSEIMRLFLAREALDPHLKIGGAVLNSQMPIKERLASAIKAGLFYSTWYPKQWLPFAGTIPAGIDPELKPMLKYINKNSRKLARKLYHAMLRYGPGLEKKQPLLARYVGVGTELFVLAASVLRADTLLKEGSPAERKELLELISFLFKETQINVDSNFTALGKNSDDCGYKFAQKVLEEIPAWLRPEKIDEAKN